jgi:hypothetical protein
MTGSIDEHGIVLCSESGLATKVWFDYTNCRLVAIEISCAAFIHSLRFENG